ncbi:hypothetical protein ACOSQ2_032034 [Xanthoceras sorbifolium]|uniref:RRM domain-containing protein n=1 Tax=Xanthoceras sorbifolium TaxID=99658 RepID=A0ABQ8H5A9_9ROSI|nr:hypothetical protein JRO89_XS14G0141000 [Xanthoceras sorbifolium]
MSALELSIRVAGLAPRVTHGDLLTFFSYCGTVDKIQIKRNKDQSQTALVTFKQPFAYQTALLLDDAILAGQAIRIVSATDLASPPPSPCRLNNKTNNNEMQGLVPAFHSEMEVIASKGVEILKKTQEEIEEKYKLSEKSTVLVKQARSIVCATEQAAGYVGSKITNGDYASTGADWLSNVLDKASKRAAELAARKRNNPNSRKWK